MTTISRRATTPVVCSVAALTLLVAGYTCAILPWFLDYFDYYAGTPNNFAMPFSTRLFRECYMGGLPLGLCVIGYGVHLLRTPERRLEHVLWYAALAVSLAALWLVWTLLAERSFYELLFPA
jgi:hypothetical protein